MDDLIRRQDAIDEINKYILSFDDIDANFLDGLKTSIKLIEPRRKGKWISEIVYAEDWKCCKWQYYQPISCSKCHSPNHYKSTYCPNCGALMERSEDE